MSPILSFALDVTIKATLVLILVATAVQLHRRASAAMRHAAWATGLLCLLVLPVLMLCLPVWRLSWLPQWRPPKEPPPQTAMLPQESWAELSVLADSPARPTDRAAAAVGRNVLPPAPSEPPRAASMALADGASSSTWTLPVLVILSWAGVAAALALVLFLATLSLRRVERRCQRIDRGPISDLCARLSRDLKLHRRVTLLQGDEGKMPMTWGIVRSRILLPADAASWPQDRLRAVLLHELAHVKRWDCLTQVLALLARAVYWFHPLAWWTVVRLRRDQERACDDVVLRHGAQAADYAETLVVLAAARPLLSLTSTVAPAISRAGKLERRIKAMLDPKGDRRPIRCTYLGALVLLACCVLVPLAMLSYRSSVRADENAAAAKQGAQDKPAQLKQITKIEAILRDRSLKPISNETMLQGAIKGILSELNDPYSQYLSAQDLALLQRNVRGNFSGIGIRIQQKEKQLIVLSPLPGSPARKAGVKQNDVITAIDGTATNDLTLQQCVERIIGPRGSKVKLTIQRGDKTMDVSITRDRVNVPTIAGFQRTGEEWSYFLDKKQGIAYLSITQLAGGTPADVSGAVKQLQKQGMKGLVLDLRFCPGGLLASAVETADLFLSKGTIVTVKCKEKEKVWKSTKESLGDFPMVVLLNENTASAAEIVAGALRDNGRAQLVGSRSHGKGTVQSLVELPDIGGALKLTTAQYFPPSGRNIDLRGRGKSWGVDPHDGYFVPVTAEEQKKLADKREKRSAIRDGNGKPEAVTPKGLEVDHGDAQLAAAMKTLLAKVNDGKWTKVGKGQAALDEHVSGLRTLSKRREELLKELKEIDQKLGK